MAEGKPPSSKGGEGGKKSGGGVWGFFDKLLKNVSIEVNVGAPGPAPRTPSGNPTDPVARMDAVRQDRKETYDELVFRSTKGAAGQAPAVRVDRERQHVARSLDQRTKQGPGAAAIPKGGGEPLSKDVRTRMEPTLGADLSDVKVHRASDSAAAAEAMNAKAFAVGSDVHFGSGQYQPGTKEGDRLLAHELTHVVQGQRSGVQRKAETAGDESAEHADGAVVSQPHEPAEKEADAVADHATEKLHGADDADHSDGGAPPAKQQAPAIGAKLADSRISLAPKSGASSSPPAKDAAASGKGDAQVVQFDMSGKQHALEGAPAADGVKLTVDKAPIAGKVRQAMETAQVKAAQGDAKGKATGPNEIVALREVLTEIQNVSLEKQVPAAQLKAELKSIADKLTHIALMTGWKSLDDAGQTLAHAKHRMAQVELTPWNCEPVYDLGEYQRQIKDQEDGVNAMMASRWATERPRYVKEGRSNDAKKAQRDFRLRTGIKGDKSKAAPHAPDGIAAGHPDPTGKPADSNINSSIGAQWGGAGRAPKVDKAVEAIPEPEKATTQMNVKMSVVKAA